MCNFKPGLNRCLNVNFTIANERSINTRYNKKSQNRIPFAKQKQFLIAYLGIPNSTACIVQQLAVTKLKEKLHFHNTYKA